MKQLHAHTLIAAVALAGWLSAPSGAGAAESPKTENTATSENHGDEVATHCVDPHACCAESEKVIETLKTMVAALNHRDLTTYQEYIDDGCTTFDENTKKLVVGKQAVVEHMQQRLIQYAPDGPTPLIRFTIDHPYAKVHGTTAVVTFVGYREIGGKHPYTEKCNVTDIFVRHGDIWKKLHYRGRWQKISSQSWKPPANDSTTLQYTAPKTSS